MMQQVMDTQANAKDALILLQPQLLFGNLQPGTALQVQLLTPMAIGANVKKWYLDMDKYGVINALKITVLLLVLNYNKLEHPILLIMDNAQIPLLKLHNILKIALLIKLRLLLLQLLLMDNLNTVL
jgi:hypothetical protein